MSSESLTDLLQKLGTYRAQLQQLETLLAGDPSNATLLKLKQDLMEVIGLTQDLINMKTSGAAPDSEPAAAPFSVGDVVEAKYMEHYFYPGTITDIDPKGNVTVRFLGYGNVETMHADDVRAIQSDRVLDDAKLRVGTTCVAKFAADQQWYSAVIDELVDGHYKVTYTEYSNSEVVPIQYIQLPEGAAAAPLESSPAARAVAAPAAPGATDAAAAAPSPRAAPAAAADASGGGDDKPKDLRLRPIPDSLKILPTDSEEEKKRKAKKLKAIKQHNKLVQKELDGQQKKSQWQSFQTKAAKKRARGFLTTVSRDSIFTTPDTVDGKVGVTGSGRGMTDFDRRKRYKLGVTPEALQEPVE